MSGEEALESEPEGYGGRSQWGRLACGPDTTGQGRSPASFWQTCRHSSIRKMWMEGDEGARPTLPRSNVCLTLPLLPLSLLSGNGSRG